MRNDVHPLDDERLITSIRSYLHEVKGATIHEIHMGISAMGHSGLKLRMLDSLIRVLFKNHVLRREFLKGKTFQYRLACDWPDWGREYVKSDFEPIESDFKNGPGIIEEYKNNSRVYEFDTLIRNVRGKI